MSGYFIDVTCLRCGAEVEHLTSNTFQSDRGSEKVEPMIDTAVTVVQCVNKACHRQWFIRTVMMDGPKTNGADSRKAQRHRESVAVLAEAG